LLKDEKKKEKIADEGILLANQLIADPELLKSALIGDLVGEFTGYEAFWIAIMKAELVAAAKGEVVGKQAWSEAADVAEKLKINPKMKGPGLRYLLIITLSKDYEKADLFSKEMLKYDPQNWDVARRRLKILVELKKFDEAVKLGEKVIKNSYDRNQFWVAETLAKAYVLSSKKEKAKALLEEFLAKPEASWGHMAGSKKKLEDLRAQLDLASGSKQ
jgi:tetratricopeptide (TPR) repeat protein